VFVGLFAEKKSYSKRFIFLLLTNGHNKWLLKISLTVTKSLTLMITQYLTPVFVTGKPIWPTVM